MTTLRMRLIHEAYAEIKANDPQTAVTEHYIRDLVTSGRIPTRRAGRRYLINMDLLEEYLRNPESETAKQEEQDGMNRIRAVL